MPEKSLDDFPVFLERHLKLQSAPDEPMTDVIIQVGYPVWVQQGLEASCPVAIRGVAGRTPHIRGVDQMDAMKNALIFIETYLTDRQGKPTFFWPNGEKY